VEIGILILNSLKVKVKVKVDSYSTLSWTHL